MQVRRTKILDAAKLIIAREGVAALNMRDLADQAGVTTPTIYNLVGNRDEIISEIVRDALNRLDARLSERASVRGLDRSVAIVMESIDIFCSDPETFRSLLRASEHLTAAGIEDTLQLERTVELQADAYRSAVAQQDLSGSFDPSLFGRSVVFGYRSAFREWASGRLTRRGFEAQALVALHVHLLADARPRTRRRLKENLELAQRDWRRDLARARRPGGSGGA